MRIVPTLDELKHRLARLLARAEHRSIQQWVKQADLDEGRRQDGKTSAERQELARLRREIKQLRLEREILAHRPDAPSGKAAAWFARETGSIPPGGLCVAR